MKDRRRGRALQASEWRGGEGDREGEWRRDWDTDMKTTCPPQRGRRKAKIERKRDRDKKEGERDGGKKENRVHCGPTSGKKIISISSTHLLCSFVHSISSVLHTHGIQMEPRLLHILAGDAEV